MLYSNVSINRGVITIVLAVFWTHSSACTRNSDCDWKCFIPRGQTEGMCTFDADHLKRLQATANQRWQEQESLRSETARSEVLRGRKVLIRHNPFGQYLADGRINGANVVFILDTGATEVTLSLSLARRLGLQLRPGGQTHTANGMVERWATRLDSVDLDGLVVRNVSASVLPNMPEDGVLLGMSYLKQLDMTQQDETLTLQLRR